MKAVFKYIITKNTNRGNGRQYMKKMDGKSLQPKIISREKSHASISDFSKELSCLVCQEIL